MERINILVTLNGKYLKQLFVLIKSISISNKEELFNLYLIYEDFCKEDFETINILKEQNKNFNIILMKMEDDVLKDAPTMKRYPKARYYRYFCCKNTSKRSRKGIIFSPRYSNNKFIKRTL